MAKMHYHSPPVIHMMVYKCNEEQKNELSFTYCCHNEMRAPDMEKGSTTYKLLYHDVISWPDKMWFHSHPIGHD